MDYITSFNILDAKIQKVNGKPIVLEALWDGDTQGWFLLMSLYYTTNGWKYKEECTHLGIVSFGGDIRLFDGDVPPWPEAVLAKEIGKEAAKKYGLVFYFPSDNKPDDSCPSWHKRHLGIHCADCGKLIIPTTSPYLPKDICYHCHLEREHVVKLKCDAPTEEKVKCFLCKNGMYESASYLTEVIEATHPVKKDGVEIITIGLPDIIELREQQRNVIEDALRHYTPSNLTGDKQKFGVFEEVEYKGKTYRLETRFNGSDRELGHLISRYNTTTKLVLEGWGYNVFFINGVTYRDDSVLRFIYYQNKGSVHITAIVERYKKSLSEHDIFETLAKLENFQLVKVESGLVKLAELGGLTL